MVISAWQFKEEISRNATNKSLILWILAGRIFINNERIITTVESRALIAIGRLRKQSTLTIGCILILQQIVFG
ncbi:MAG: hypothetical protein ACRBCI_12235 [Cellvibrionaceae bacterium]